ncbi:mannose-6-phosphate isomerase [Clostridium botulinum]|nr:mannose-6-phosphate isomerase [Clostridium botulinum]
MYPLKFENIYLNKVWGGRSLKKFRDNLPKGNIGESWDIAFHKDLISVIKNGELKGENLKDAIQLYKNKLMGDAIFDKYNEFPLILKIISAEEKLSIQVHPGKEDVLDYMERPKKEAWYVMDAKVGSYIILGSKIKDKDKLKQAINNGTVEKHLYKVPVKKGDVFYIKSGMIHAIGKGVTLIEIQQNSDTTYRLYDYNRGRKLDLEKGMNCVNLDIKPNKKSGLKVQLKNCNKTYCFLSKAFAMEKYEVNYFLKEKSDKERFFIFTCVDGQGQINYKEGRQNLSRGESILIPAYMGEYTLRGSMNLLKFYIPNIEKTIKNIVNIVRC